MFLLFSVKSIEILIDDENTCSNLCAAAQHFNYMYLPLLLQLCCYHLNVHFV